MDIMNEQVDELVCGKFGCKEQSAGRGDERHSDAEKRDDRSHDCAKRDVVSVRELKILKQNVGQILKSSGVGAKVYIFVQGFRVLYQVAKGTSSLTADDPIVIFLTSLFHNSKIISGRWRS